MARGKYIDVVLIGFGEIYKGLLKYLISVNEYWEFNLNVIEHELYPLSRIESVCVSSGVQYSKLKKKEEVLSFLLGFNKETLVISAGNKYLFPKILIEKENITIINFHNALLPAYPGRNAPSWAIYNGEHYVGATWHMVTEDIDAGAILWQKACELTPDIKAYEASKFIMKLAYEGFEEISDMLFSGDIKTVSQKVDISERRIYYSKDVPGNGIVKITDTPEYIYRVLRATDYGLNHVFPKIKIIVENEEICIIKRYGKEIKSGGRLNEPLKKYYLRLDDEYYLRLDVERVASGQNY